MKHAKSILLFSHTEFSLQFHPAGIGEITHSAKLEILLKKTFKNEKIKRIDIYDFFNRDENFFSSLAELNYGLAESGEDPLSLEETVCSEFYEAARKQNPKVALFFTWCWGQAALSALGLSKLCPTVGKIYAFHPNERLFPSLYSTCDLLVTESPLGNDRAHAYGINKGKLLYLPHQVPASIQKIKPHFFYLQRLAQEQGKQIKGDPIVIGLVSRFERRKNCDAAFRCMQKLIDQGYPILFVLKGDFIAPLVQLPQDFVELTKKPWFLWDQKRTPYPAILQEMATFDIILQLSGYESASNGIVESLALGKPTVILNASSNPYLFNQAACFVKPGKLHLGSPMPFFEPNEDDLFQVVERLVKEVSLREEVGRQAQKIALQRFHPRRAQERLPLMVQAAEGYYKGDASYEKTLLLLNEKDQEEYEIDFIPTMR